MKIRKEKEGELVVIEIEDWNAVGMSQRYEALNDWVRDSDLKGIRLFMRVEVPKKHFIELWKLWSMVPPTEDELAKWERWLREE